MNHILGLTLSLTDNATAGINNAVSSLTQLTQVAENASSSMDKMASLSAFSIVSDRIGSSFLSMGKNVIGTLTGVVSKVNETGQTLMYAEKQLNALYKDDTAGKRVIAQIQDYAKKSMFEFENLIPAVTSLKSVGIEAFDSITTSMGNSKNNLLDYASALASFAPQMRNAYGTGINAAMGAMREYIAEGNKRSLKSGAGLDITQILGEDKGATIEDRTRQVADLIEQLGMLGMVDTMKESPMVKLSNMGDVLFQFVGMVSQSGVYDAISGLISIFGDFVDSISDERLQEFASIVGSALTSLIKPIEWISKKIVTLAEGLLKLVESNPELIKLITIGSAVIGTLLLLSGIALKVASSFSSLAVMVFSSGKSIKEISVLFRTGILNMVGTLLPFLAMIGLLRIAWKNDFAGIKTSVTNFVANLRGSFNTAKEAVSGSVGDLTKTLTDLKNKDDFFSNLTRGMIKVMIVGQALSDAWGDYTLSEENYLKAKEAGVLPLIEAILDLKYRFGFFKQGFIQGWQEISNKVKSFFGGLKSSIDGTIFEDMLSSLTDFFNKLSNNDAESWKELGKTVGELTAKLFTAGTVVTLIGGSTKKVSKTFSGLFSVIKPIFGLITAHPVIALVVGLVGALALLYAKCEPFREFVNELFGTIQQSFSSIIEPMKEVFLSLLISAIPIVVQLIEAFKQFIPQILPFITQIGEMVTTVIGSVMQIAIGILPVIMNIVGTVISTIVALMPTFMNIFSAIMSVVQAVIPIVTQLIGMLTPFIVQLVNLLGQFVANILPIIVSLINEIVPIITNVIALILPMIRDIVTNLMPVIQTVLNVIISLVMKLLPIIQTVVGVVAKIIAMAVKIAAVIIPVIVQIVQAIVSVLIPIIDVIIATIGFIADKVVGFVQIVISVISMIATILVGIIEVVVSIIGVIVQYVMRFFSTAVGIVTLIVETVANIIKGIITVAQTIWDGIVSVFSGVIDFFTGIFETVFDVVSGVFTKIGEFFTNVWNGIVTAFNTLGDTISGAIKGAINGVLSGAVRIINGFISAINLAIGIINAIPGISISKLTTLTVPQLATGGVVDKPTTAIIGEAGKEAVVPLENNLGWIDSLATMITAKMTGNIVPSNSRAITNNTNQGDNNQRYLTNNNTSNTTYEGNTDNSIIFNSGAIQVNVQNASEEEALKFAKKILEYIKRQKELDRMLCYA